MQPQQDPTMSTSVLSYYEAIEQASADMLDAARAGDLAAYREAVEAHYAPLLRVLDSTAPSGTDAN